MVTDKIILLLFVVYGSKAQQYNGDVCTTKEGEAAKCTPVGQCWQVLAALRIGISPVTCGFEGNIPIVCCGTRFPIHEPISEAMSGEECPMEQCETGKCIHFKQCPQAINAFTSGINPKLCGFQGNEPLICCDTSTPINESISQRKCREYANFDSQFHISAIVGGIKATRSEFPHMAALGFTNGTKILWICGGSLVSENYVLTAAHCLAHRSYGKVSRVRLGITDLPAFSTSNDFPTTDYMICSLHPHPDYRFPSKYHDIALIRLARPVQFSITVRPACLSNQPVKIGEKLDATGWGFTEHQKMSETLQKVTLDVANESKCKSGYEDMTGTRMLKEGIIEGQFCTKGKNNNQDTCQGDSGGPLQIGTNRHIWTVVGVTSFGKGCGGPVPGLNTKISYYLPWLESVIWSNTSPYCQTNIASY